ncbi:MAG: glycine cleavage system aminomethyltransferase T, partial [Gammaproteobacteria bacterium]
VESGAAHGLRLGGMHALDSGRIEKKFLHFGHDVGDEDTPLEAGVRFVCDFEKESRFIGYDALAKAREARPTKRLVQFLLQDPEVMLYQHEPILCDGKTVGYLTSGNYGHTLGGAVGLGYVHHEEGVTSGFLKSASFAIDVAGDAVPAQASLRALYDPRGERVRG